MRVQSVKNTNQKLNFEAKKVNKALLAKRGKVFEGYPERLFDFPSINNFIEDPHASITYGSCQEQIKNIQKLLKEWIVFPTTDKEHGMLITLGRRSEEHNGKYSPLVKYIERLRDTADEVNIKVILGDATIKRAKATINKRLAALEAKERALRESLNDCEYDPSKKDW